MFVSSLTEKVYVIITDALDSHMGQDIFITDLTGMRHEAFLIREP
jgi:hypothetical protein